MQGGVAESPIRTFMNSMPRITRYWLISVGVSSLVARFHPNLLAYSAVDYDSVFKNFEVWRLVTSLIVFPLTPHSGYNFLITLYLLHSVSSALETGHFSNREGDYVYMILFISIISLISSIFVYPFYFLCSGVVMGILYVWSQIESEALVSFMFGFTVKAMYLPYTLFALNFLIFGGGLENLLGIFTGHAYYFMQYRYPVDFGGSQLLQTPNFILKLFPNKIQQRSTNSQTPNQGHQWQGRGRRLDE